MTRGETLQGLVVDSDGSPVQGARITITGNPTIAARNQAPSDANTPESPANESVAERRTTDKSGRFRARLRKGIYRVTTAHPDYWPTEARRATDSANLRLTLPRPPSIRLRVHAVDGRPVKSYRAQLLGPNLTPVGLSRIAVTPSDYAADPNKAWATVRLPVHRSPRGFPMNCRLLIEHSAHAKSLSPVFAVQPGPPVTVEAKLALGASIHGLVTDTSGNPVSGARISTEIDMGLLSAFLPIHYTVAHTHTDNSGAFILQRLGLADYNLTVTHPRFCTLVTGNHSVTKDGESARADLQLQTGTLVEGFTRRGTQSLGRVELTMSGTPPDASTSVPLTRFGKAISDARGYFRLRLPPGSYTIQASKADSFFASLWFEPKSLEIPRGKKQLYQDITFH